MKIFSLILALMFLFPLFNFLIGIHPPRFHTDDNPKHYGLHFEQVEFSTEDGVTLRGWYIPVESPSSGRLDKKKETPSACGTILVGHGYPFDKANILRHALFLHSRFNLFLFDFRYFGESDGAYTTAGLLETRDVKAAAAYVSRRTDVDTTRIGAMGFSLSAATFILARNPDLKAIVADSPYASLEKVVERQFFFLPGPMKWPFVELTKWYVRMVLGLDLHDADPAKAVEELNHPLFLIHGQEDSQIPVEHSREIHARANPELTKLWVVPRADHGLAHALEGFHYEIRVINFFERHLCTPLIPRAKKHIIH